MSSVRVLRYSKQDERTWNDFVGKSKNATFLFNRGFMDYHASRFTDHSLLIYHNNSLKALLPANEVGDALISHGGLSYGGMVLDEKVTVEEVVCLFFHAMKYLVETGIKTITYKCIPANFARLPSFEDQFAIFLLDGRLIRRDMSAVHDKGYGLSLGQTRKSIVRKSGPHVEIVKTKDPSRFYEVLHSNLMDRHGVSPVHSLEEIRLLMRRFPEQIHCFEVVDHRVLGGTLIFETETCAHAQYIASNPEGKKIGALDVLFSQLIFKTFASRENFSFGMSNERDPRKLNTGLNFWKESFGARVIPVDTYEIQTANHQRLSDYA